MSSKLPASSTDFAAGKSSFSFSKTYSEDQPELNLNNPFVSQSVHYESSYSSSVKSCCKCGNFERGRKRRKNSHESQENLVPPTHDWTGEPPAQGNFFDDGTLTYFWRAHTLTTLFLMVGFLLYEALSTEDQNVVDNTKRGLVAMVSCFVLLGVTVTPDGPFKRPHPALWRFTFTCSIVYELCLIFFLYQSTDTARKLLKHLDPKLGVPLEEKDYGGNCLLYDPSMPEDPYHNIWDKMDLFVPLHLLGWWSKTLLLRDWWLCWVISIMFEVLEYTLEHQLPNFSECWWDHWIMDALVCNGLGIYFGLLTLNYFSMKTYHWRGLWNIPSYRGKLRRILAQFGPYVWVDYDWKPFSSLGRWCAVLLLIAGFLLVELNTFYLKFVLWIPPGHWVNLCRLLLVLPWGAVALRETFQFLDDPDVDKIGRQSWIFLAIICTELLIVLKFGWETVTIPFPRHIVSLWLGILVLLVLWTLWNFYIDPHTFKVDSSMSEDSRRQHWTQVRAIETKLSPSERIEAFFNLERLKTRIAETLTTLTSSSAAIPTNSTFTTSATTQTGATPTHGLKTGNADVVKDQDSSGTSLSKRIVTKT
ncbi:phosphatidylserine synthase 2 [Hyalella azteca]|uniref:Phosphatidylserine synthase n=1 Tax=Hyalella azteca TaxID=294128 RepID=A0A8B7NAG8_HYAAZ|nr:phosphatidylserine synthase 2 [Hyalella azteca]